MDVVWVIVHGLLGEIVSDKDPKFTSSFWRSFQRELSTETKFSTTYVTPQIRLTREPNRNIKGHPIKSANLNLTQMDLHLAT